MYLFVVATHVLLSLLLILIIILQPGKGGDVGAAFGGGGGGSSSSLFGPRGPASLLARATTFVAVGFMGTSITLAYYSKADLISNANVADELRRLEEKKRSQGEDEGAALEDAIPGEATLKDPSVAPEEEVTPADEAGEDVEGVDEGAVDPE